MWSMYPTLIEYIIQYLMFMDYEFMQMTEENHVTPEHLDKNNQFHFVDLLEYFPFNSQFKIGESNGIVFCLFNSQ